MIQAMLADSVTELWAARLMTYEAAAMQDRGEPVALIHTHCSMAKLYASEMANRVADRVVQIFGGRGYMRSNPAQRWGRPEELVGTAIFLASGASSYVNGQIIYVDGGWLSVL
jgi:alkylation response protein AidB-like acyl-CoA dehydrogenase